MKSDNVPWGSIEYDKVRCLFRKLSWLGTRRGSGLPQRDLPGSCIWFINFLHGPCQNHVSSPSHIPGFVMPLCEPWKLGWRSQPAVKANYFGQIFDSLPIQSCPTIRDRRSTTYHILVPRGEVWSIVLPDKLIYIVRTYEVHDWQVRN